MMDVRIKPQDWWINGLMDWWRERERQGCALLGGSGGTFFGQWSLPPGIWIGGASAAS
jgi:hypothetical protein